MTDPLRTKLTVIYKLYHSINEHTGSVSGILTTIVQLPDKPIREIPIYGWADVDSVSMLETEAKIKMDETSRNFMQKMYDEHNIIVDVYVELYAATGSPEMVETEVEIFDVAPN